MHLLSIIQAEGDEPAAPGTAPEEASKKKLPAKLLARLAKRGIVQAVCACLLQRSSITRAYACCCCIITQHSTAGFMIWEIRKSRALQTAFLTVGLRFLCSIDTLVQLNPLSHVKIEQSIWAQTGILILCGYCAAAAMLLDLVHCSSATHFYRHMKQAQAACSSMHCSYHSTATCLHPLY